MTTSLARAVARVTGESPVTIRRMGFSLLGRVDADADLDGYFRPQAVDWDRLDAKRVGVLPQRARDRRKSA